MNFLLIHWSMRMLLPLLIAVLITLKSDGVMPQPCSICSSLLWLFEVFCGSICILGLFFSVPVKNANIILVRIVFCLFVSVVWKF